MAIGEIHLEEIVCFFDSCFKKLRIAGLFLKSLDTFFYIFHKKYVYYPHLMSEHPRITYGIENAAKAADIIKKEVKKRGWKLNIDDGVILGSGLGGFAKNHMNYETGSGIEPIAISFDEIFKKLGLPASGKKGVPGHAKQILVGPLNDGDPNRLVFGQAGREHPYEGIELARAVFWIRVMQVLGVQKLIGSNAAGILSDKTLDIPSIMLLRSDQDITQTSPGEGPNNSDEGPRFPHMGNVHTEDFRKEIKQTASEINVDIKEGTYFRVKGPIYERPEDLYRLRADLDNIWKYGKEQKGENRFSGEPVGVVGMSSTYELETAQHASQSSLYPAFAKKAYLSAITNYAAAMGPEGFAGNLSHDEVKGNAAKVEKDFGRLVAEMLKK